MSSQGSRTVNSFGAFVLALKDKLNNSRQTPADFETHIKGAVEWLYHAQDGTDDKGFSRSFGLKYGWHPSYPETSGYIIPTLIDYGHKFNDREAIKRALEASDWLIEVQTEDGGIPAGSISSTPKPPTIFNTGQVIFGWNSAYLETGDEKYLKAFSKACNWLAEAQSEDGLWRKHTSTETKYSVNTYNVRVAFAMLDSSIITGNEQWKNAAIRKADWALTQQTESGWFKNNCLGINERPLTHTISYTTRGLLEIGMKTKTDKYIQAAKRSAEGMLSAMRPNGYIPGRLYENWSEGVNYNCLTGACQMSIVWCKLYKLGFGDKFLEGATKALAFVASTQDLTNSNDGIRGGIKGSYPINGIYGRYEYLNWAAKFYIDALMLYSDITGSKSFQNS